MNNFYFIPVSIVLIVVPICYVLYHDFAIDAQNIVSRWDCGNLKYWLDKEGQKISKNLFTGEVQKVYDSRCLDD